MVHTEFAVIKLESRVASRQKFACERQSTVTLMEVSVFGLK